MKKSGIIALILALALAMGVTACSNESGKTKAAAPVITVDTTPIKTRSFTSVTLPKATAADETDGDLSEYCSVSVFYETEQEYVYPYVNPEQGAVANEENVFTPSKIGEYEVRYTVTNTNRKTAEVTIPMTVEYNPDYVKKPNYVADPNNWVLGADSMFNEYGELVVGTDGNSETAPAGFSSVALKTKKIHNEIVSISFNADPLEGNMFYNIGYRASKSASLDAPATNEAEWPQYYFFRMSEKELMFNGSVINNERVSMGNMTTALCDGNDHVIHIQFEDSGSEENGDALVTFRLWIDKPFTSNYDYEYSIEPSTLGKMPGGGITPDKPAVFGDDSAGYLFIGGYRNTGKGEDAMTIKSVAIDGDAFTTAPIITAQRPDEVYVVNEAITFAKATAKDGNDYSNISDRVQAALILPDETKISLDSSMAYTPDQLGEYKIIYSVRDDSANVSKVEYDFIVAFSKENTVAPEIVLTDETPEHTFRLGEEITVPGATANDDADGNVTARMKVEIVGPEAREIKAGDTIKIYTNEEFVVKYSCKDWNGNESVKQITYRPEHTTPQGNLLAAENVYATAGVCATEGDYAGRYMLGLASGGNGAVVYKNQRIYDEKVTVTFKWGQMGTGNIALMDLTIRGGSVNEIQPGEAGNTAFSWPTGLKLRISPAAILLMHGTAEVIKTPGNYFEDTANGEEVTVQYQATDVYEGDVFMGVLVKVWINGEKFNFNSGAYVDENGDCWLPARLVANNPNYSQSAWLNIWANGTTAENPIEVTSITIEE